MIYHAYAHVAGRGCLSALKDDVKAARTLDRASGLIT